MGMTIALLTFAAAALVARGLRGRRTDDHPVCRRCRFDLTGRPPTSTRCPECGADLTDRRATRVGHRQRRPLPLAAGVLLVLLAGGLVGGRLSPAYRAPERYKPVWWLTHDLQTGKEAPCTTAVTELMRRWDVGKLNGSQKVEVVDALLDVQGDRDRPWDRSWGDVVERLHSSGTLPSAAQWPRYLRQTATFLLRVRPVVRASDLVPVELVQLPARGASDWGFLQPLKSTVAAAVSTPDSGGQIEWPYTDGHLLTQPLDDRTTSSPFHFRLTPDPDGRVAVGPRQVGVRIHVVIASNEPHDTVEADLVLTGRVRVVPDTEDTVRPSDAAFERSIKAMFRVQLVKAEASAGKLDTVTMRTAYGDEATASYAFAIYTIQNQTERRLANDDLFRGHNSTEQFIERWGFRSIQIDPDAREPAVPPRTDIVLRVSPEIARDTVDQTTYLSHDVIFRNVEVVTR